MTTTTDSNDLSALAGICTRACGFDVTIPDLADFFGPSPSALERFTDNQKHMIQMALFDALSVDEEDSGN